MKDPIINENTTKVLPKEIIVEYDKTKTSSVNDQKIENNSISPKKKFTPKKVENENNSVSTSRNNVFVIYRC